MNPYQEMVRDFHQKFGIKVNADPTAFYYLTKKQRDLRIKLMEEELNELKTAWKKGDLVEVIDGYMDLLYVTFGGLITIGIWDTDPFFKEVHRTNLLKVGGHFRKDGKYVKPKGWKPPEIARLLSEIFGGPFITLERQMKRKRKAA